MLRTSLLREAIKYKLQNTNKYLVNTELQVKEWNY